MDSDFLRVQSHVVLRLKTNHCLHHEILCDRHKGPYNACELTNLWFTSLVYIQLSVNTTALPIVIWICLTYFSFVLLIYCFCSNKVGIHSKLLREHWIEHPIQFILVPEPMNKWSQFIKWSGPSSIQQCSQIHAAGVVPVNTRTGLPELAEMDYENCWNIKTEN